MVIVRGKMRAHALDVIFPIVWSSSVRIVPDHLRLALDLAVCAFWAAPDIAHVSLLAWTDSPIVVEGGHAPLVMKTSDLQLAELHVKIGDEVLKDVSALRHQLGRLLVRDDLLDVLLRPLEVREEKNEDLALVA